jgi:hypothetical protein
MEDPTFSGAPKSPYIGKDYMHEITTEGNNRVVIPGRD